MAEAQTCGSLAVPHPPGAPGQAAPRAQSRCRGAGAGSRQMDMLGNHTSLLMHVCGFSPCSPSPGTCALEERTLGRPGEEGHLAVVSH